MTPDPYSRLDPQARARRERRRRARAARIRRRRLIALAVLLLAIGIPAVLISGLGRGSSDQAGSGNALAAKNRFAVPPLLDPHDVYAADRPGMLAPAVRSFPARVYVPNSESNTVSVINPNTYKVIDQFPVGDLPQHVVPSYDLKTLLVNNDQGNSLTPINPRTGRPGRTISVTDPSGAAVADT